MSTIGAAQPCDAPGETPRLEASLVYLYAVLPAGSIAVQRLAAGTINGLVDGAPLFGIEADSLIAAVSLVPAAQFDEAPLADLLADLARLSPLAVRHENAVHALHERTNAIVPVSFGTIYRDTVAVERLLREGATQLQATLARVRDRQEWGVKLFAEPQALGRVAEAASDDLRRLDAEIAAAQPGRAYLLAKRREQQLAIEAERLGSELAAAILSRLAPLCDETRQDQAALANGASRLLLKVAFLIADAEVDRFLAEAAAIERECAAMALTMQCSGPWAPYSFAAPCDAASETTTSDTITFGMFASGAEPRQESVSGDRV